MKYLVFVPDGCADVPLAELGGRTPLEAARMPRLAALAAPRRSRPRRGDPAGLPAGQRRRQHGDPRLRPRAVPHRSRADRGRGDGCRARTRRSRVPLQPRHALRRRAADDGRLRGRSSDERAEPRDRRRARRRRSATDATACASIPVSSTATCVVVPRAWADAECTPPHDLTGQPAVFPTGAASPQLHALMDASRADRARRRGATVGSSATQIWLWGQGVKPALPSFEATFGVAGRMSSAVDLVQGLGVLTGIEVVDVPGATAGFDNDYAAQRDACIRSLDDSRPVRAARRGDRRSRAPGPRRHQGRRARTLGRRRHRPDRRRARRRRRRRTAFC